MMSSRIMPRNEGGDCLLARLLGGQVVPFLDYLDHVVQRGVAGERDSTTLDELIERHW
jgi:hypothetical protein